MEEKKRFIFIFIKFIKVIDLNYGTIKFRFRN